MANRTNTELILEARSSIAAQEVQLALLKERFDRREGAVDLLTAADAGHDRRLAVAESQIADLKRAAEERDKQRWSAWLVLAGSGLTLVVNLVLLVLRK